MAIVGTRTIEQIERGFAAWYGTTHPGEAPSIAVESHLSGGRSNEIYFVTVTPRAEAARRLVVRLPPAGPALFPSYDLAAQAAIHNGLTPAGIPAPSPSEHVADERWLGAPFLVMPRLDGRDAGDAPAFTPWITDVDLADQRVLHVRFLDLLAAIHRASLTDLPFVPMLRGGSVAAAGDGLDDELQWWTDAVAWMFDGEPPRPLVDVFERLRRRRPVSIPAPSLLWGDVRLGNVLVDDDLRPIAVLDWEMASVGPAEQDVAWYTALEATTEHFAGTRVPGFLTRDEIVAHHEAQLGRRLVDLEWFEGFALARSAALHLRAERLRAEAKGRSPRPPDDDAMLAHVVEQVP